ncbi:MAG TPA: cytochrome c [Pyrinomonadaceae bacterium]|nr:cytochrome c [Pyrinomonadaceae bacterium]
MKFLKIVVVAACIAFAVLACENGKGSRKSYVIADSKAYEASIFRQNCAVCHGQEANGKEIDGKIIPSLRYGNAEKKSEQEIYDQIKNGKLPMPAFKDQLTEEEIQKMVRFIRRDLQGKEENEPQNNTK